MKRRIREAIIITAIVLDVALRTAWRWWRTGDLEP